jgi:hypothetical protein
VAVLGGRGYFYFSLDISTFLFFLNILFHPTGRRLFIGRCGGTRL